MTTAKYPAICIVRPGAPELAMCGTFPDKGVWSEQSTPFETSPLYLVVAPWATPTELEKASARYGVLPDLLRNFQIQS